jgi:hypothetical protein
MGTPRVQMKGVLPWFVRWALRASGEIFVLPWLTQLTQYKIFFPHRTLFQFIIVPIAQQAGQAAVPGRLSFNMWPWCRPEVEFLEEIQTEVLRVFLLAIHRHLLYSPPSVLWT